MLYKCPSIRIYIYIYTHAFISQGTGVRIKLISRKFNEYRVCFFFYFRIIILSNKNSPFVIFNYSKCILNTNSVLLIFYKRECNNLITIG